MDPLSIATSCIALVTTLTRVSVQINCFVRDVRDARKDLDAVSREIHSLKTVLEILSEDAQDPARFPRSLVQQVSGILTNCGAILDEIETLLQRYSRPGLKRGVEWSISGRDDMNKLRSNLEAHKSALDIALDMAALSMARDIKADTQEILNDTTDIKDNTAQILAEIAKLQARLPSSDKVYGGAGYMLLRYLDDLSSYAESVCHVSDGEFDGGIDIKHQEIHQNSYGMGEDPPPAPKLPLPEPPTRRTKGDVLLPEKSVEGKRVNKRMPRTRTAEIPSSEQLLETKKVKKRASLDRMVVKEPSEQQVRRMPMTKSIPPEQRVERSFADRMMLIKSSNSLEGSKMVLGKATPLPGAQMKLQLNQPLEVTAAAMKKERARKRVEAAEREILLSKGAQMRDGAAGNVSAPSVTSMLGTTRWHENDTLRLQAQQRGWIEEGERGSLLRLKPPSRPKTDFLLHEKNLQHLAILSGRVVSQHAFNPGLPVIPIKEPATEFLPPAYKPATALMQIPQEDPTANSRAVASAPPLRSILKNITSFTGSPDKVIAPEESAQLNARPRPGMLSSLPHSRWQGVTPIPLVRELDNRLLSELGVIDSRRKFLDSTAYTARPRSSPDRPQSRRNSLGHEAVKNISPERDSTPRSRSVVSRRFSFRWLVRSVLPERDSERRKRHNFDSGRTAQRTGSFDSVRTACQRPGSVEIGRSSWRQSRSSVKSRRGSTSTQAEGGRRSSSLRRQIRSSLGSSKGSTHYLDGTKKSKGGDELWGYTGVSGSAKKALDFVSRRGKYSTPSKEMRHRGSRGSIARYALDSRPGSTPGSRRGSIKDSRQDSKPGSRSRYSDGNLSQKFGRRPMVWV